MNWNNKKVLITGHTGFKGSWLSYILYSKGATVAGYSLPPYTKPNLFETLGLSKKIKSIFGDIRDLDNLKKVMSELQPEIVFHLAAQPLVKRSYADPIETFETNAIGTAKVLESMRGVESIKAAVFITSDKCYENNGWVWPYREDDKLGGYDPYSSSKACAELVITSYRASFFTTTQNKIQLASTRAGNVIGGGDWSKDRIVPDIVKAIYADQKLSIRNPDAVRPWQHVMEPLNGYIMLAEKLYDEGEKFAQAWNFGPNNTESVPVKDIVKQAAEVSDKKIDLELSTENHPHEAGYLTLDSAKAKKILGWKQKLTTAGAIKLTMEWYNAFYNKEEMNKFTLDQIKEYEKI